MTVNIEVELSQSQQKFLIRVFAEVFGGGSTTAIQNVLGDQVDAARLLESHLRELVALDAKTISLSDVQWRTMYEAINAVIYGLGQFELDTCAGFDLQQACNTNLKICAAVWGVYGGSLWESPKEDSK